MTYRYKFHYSSFILFEQYDVNLLGDIPKSKLKVNFSKISFSLHLYLKSFFPRFCFSTQFLQFFKYSTTFFQFLEVVNYNLLLQDFSKDLRTSVLLPLAVTKKVQIRATHTIYFWYPAWVNFAQLHMLPISLRY